MAIYCKLSSILGEKRINQAKLSRITGLSKVTINHLYHDKAGKVSYHVIDKLCAALEVTPGDLLEYKPGEKKGIQ